MQAWLERYSEEAMAPPIADDVPRRIDEHIALQMPELAEDPMLVADLHASTRAQWRLFAANLTSEHSFAVLPQAADLARSLARRGLEVSVLLKVYRSAHKVLFDYFAQVSASVGPEGPAPDELLTYLWTRGEQWLNDSVEALIDTYDDERQRLADGAVQRRTELVTALLGGSGGDIERVSRDLGHRVGHWQTAAVLWLDEADDLSTTSGVLGELTGRIAQALDAPPPLTLVAGSREIWLWAASPSRPDLGRLDDLVAVLATAGAHLAVGSPARGLIGFRSSHAEARAAERVGLAAPQAPALLSYPSVEVLCLVAGAPELTHRMVSRELGGLASSDRNIGLLRETALVYLESGANVEVTAERMFVHKNTVRYRLARAEELRGDPLGERGALLEIALRHAALHGVPE